MHQMWKRREFVAQFASMRSQQRHGVIMLSVETQNVNLFSHTPTPKHACRIHKLQISTRNVITNREEEKHKNNVKPTLLTRT